MFARAAIRAAQEDFTLHQEDNNQDATDSTTRDCAEFWPSPIAWARLHEADVPADSIDLFVTPSGFDAAHGLPHSGAVWGTK